MPSLIIFVRIRSNVVILRITLIFYSYSFVFNIGDSGKLSNAPFSLNAFYSCSDRLLNCIGV